MKKGYACACAVLAGLGGLSGTVQAQVLAANSTVETVVVTARLRPEDAQTVPLSLSVVNASTLAVSRTDNTNQLQLLAPSLNYGSPNPRNTSYTIRGLGSSVVGSTSPSVITQVSTLTLPCCIDSHASCAASRRVATRVRPPGITRHPPRPSVIA